MVEKARKLVDLQVSPNEQEEVANTTYVPGMKGVNRICRRIFVRADMREIDI